MEEKDVQRLIDMLYNMIDEAKSVAFSAEKCAINRDEALDILDEMRAKLPLELKKAKELIAARNDYVAGAKKEVEKMMRQAELDAKTIVSESEVIQQARQKSADIIRRAMIRVEDALAEKKLSAQMLLQEHDELIFEVPDNEVAATLPVVQKVMQDAPFLAVILSLPLQVDARAANNWEEAH